ncbi:hypothetical protein F8C76_14300 [Flagellimonas olearia]|uniref:Secreted protein n=1 Tax=Flagellimonas olearia TaxID=552546 RepID=A0A6I1DY26_9FLAO|nr:hypothetical protein [Allomuricauda olearia]KAB7529014.1 hypothetical protein F8C76_14300 [Allomuricauda olearia]
MKFLAVSLSLFTVLLSSYPCCEEAGSCSGISTVVDHCGDDGGQETPHGKDTPCSPFYTCGRCPGFTISYETLELVSLDPEPQTLPIPYIELLPKEVYFHSLKPPRTIEV